MPILIPFDPKKHKAIDLPGGSKATEYTATAEAPDGGAWNIPQIWFNSKTGEPKLLTGDAAWNAAKDYEDSSGRKFPRFTSISVAEKAAAGRSDKGGASEKALASGGMRPKARPKRMLKLK